MTQYVSVPDAPPSAAEIKRQRTDPATYGLDEQHHRVTQTWYEAPIQRGVTEDQPCSGLRTPIIRKVG